VSAIALLGVHICNRLAPPHVGVSDFIPDFESPEPGVLGIAKQLAAGGLPVVFGAKP